MHLKDRRFVLRGFHMLWPQVPFRTSLRPSQYLSDARYPGDHSGFGEYAEDITSICSALAALHEKASEKSTRVQYPNHHIAGVSGDHLKVRDQSIEAHLEYFPRRVSASVDRQ